ncbi:2-amino-4-hydroxy-6-hydroxymethyldihydropteridine diphosphokinase [Bacillus alkalicellulosilyticus]|uniref:2-amino-4-hydroxy-6- hydroxymethyldihydropteridine diphosphokinase n=1 Tax=Alkalihalobacterium alkalicellulosilyticum TaxID=1912214 RepID=UPI000998D9A6|nr:2-amino-4-hydroxy-6-hydroxymethyldihydropteridine diphosphokinase [Bacillus alkalicellulosilyticus]
MNNLAYVGLGSNLGDRERYLAAGIQAIEDHDFCAVSRCSSIYETEPIGFVEQASFLNMVVEVKTSLQPRELLEALKKIEESADRKREVRWGPRTLDLDILLFNQQNIKVDDLQIPHPRMTERAFVIVPLQEINPLLYVPGINKTVKDIYETLPDKEGVNVWKIQT